MSLKSCRFKIGDAVKIINQPHTFNIVKSEDIGIVVEIIGSILIIKFNTNKITLNDYCVTYATPLAELL